MQAVETLSDRELIQETGRLRAREKEALYGLLLHLDEIDKRKLYRDEGYSSLFTYLTEGLGYSEASAYRRVEGARFLKLRPELYGELRAGRLSFSALVELSKCKESEKLESLVEVSKGKSLKEVSSLVLNADMR